MAFMFENMILKYGLVSFVVTILSTFEAKTLTNQN